jgi:hypothetical protein
MIVRRGFPAPPSFHDARAYAMTSDQIYTVITAGTGAMAPYANSLEPTDRCAVVAYIRALQLSQNAPLSAVPSTERASLDHDHSDDQSSRTMP